MWIGVDWPSSIAAGLGMRQIQVEWLNRSGETSAGMERRNWLELNAAPQQGVSSVRSVDLATRRAATSSLWSLLQSPAIVLLGILMFAGCSTTADPVAYIAPPSIEASKYAAIVVDGNSGRVLFQSNADAPRYPASLTKMMVLYMVFEALDKGQISKSTAIPVSFNAASRPPTRIGFKLGQSIDVETAIKALATKSANDVAAAVAEFLGGSEGQFAQMMTAKARDVGMTATVFRNASGLPDPAQKTTARDMAVLGLVLRRRFPHHYHYFSLREFTYGGRTIRGHNDLLARNDVDGIKTGYIRASGFNVATSVSSNGRRLVAVVMGGKSAKSRNAHMEQLVDRYLPQATGMSADALTARPGVF
jgi:D-alanyl-D-alanine carboxypeptidase